MSDLVARNLATVDAHIRGEAQDPAAVMALYAPGIVLEVPSRGLRFETLAEIEANYRRMFASMAEIELTPGERFATEDRVVDDCHVRFRITGDGLTNAPYGIGTRVELRLLHIFAMQDGLIARETVFEGWRRLD
ncbi:nuclear transport factor 2 family protein [Roseococcus sp. SDR]|uniref:nuclear transport factor 2 family protein n=1 Tax=Roseococcus sp. SDR TaxID=2835532 RepID=UPI001BCAA2AC|nr:nuclear transport factor 2 family protein [Roseococcus sp. SDR]MBS7788878.1 nuclear transport factor 2 family protein [Roseococcus sp. SDR]MBV1844192.1 nuclear transport factor 2 family protein [Roseococcus sp. SDR]